MTPFKFIVYNDDCPYCYPEEAMWCGNLGKQCNRDECPFKDGIEEYEELATEKGQSCDYQA